MRGSPTLRFALSDAAHLRVRGVRVFVVYGTAMRPLFFVALLGVSLACSSASGPNPLVGTWKASITPQTGSTMDLTMTIDASGSLTYGVAGTGTCSGTLDYSGFTWTSTATTISTSGTSSCSGAGVTCGANVLTCGSTGVTSGVCDYVLSNGNNTLDLSGCSSQNSSLEGTFTRQ